MMYHYNCTNQYYERTGYLYLFFFYCFICVISIRSYCCIKTNRPRFYISEQILILVVILKTANNYLSMNILSECPWLNVNHKAKMELGQVFLRSMGYNLQIAMFIMILSGTGVTRDKFKLWQGYQTAILVLCQLMTDFIHE